MASGKLNTPEYDALSVAASLVSVSGMTGFQ